VTNWDGVLE